LIDLDNQSINSLLNDTSWQNHIPFNVIKK